ncbi:MAG: hypothetical protein ACR2MG_09540 [Pyrinomonadaceae bacterium]
MTENQEKEMFNILSTLVTEVRGIKGDVQDLKSDVRDIKETQNEHSRILNKHSQILDNHSQILNEHSQILDEHSRILKRLDAKTDSIAETIMTNDKRLTTVEKDVADLRSGIH